VLPERTVAGWDAVPVVPPAAVSPVRLVDLGLFLRANVSAALPAAR
jgi:hypothetical protein